METSKKKKKEITLIKLDVSLIKEEKYSFYILSSMDELDWYVIRNIYIQTRKHARRINWIYMYVRSLNRKSFENVGNNIERKK